VPRDMMRRGGRLDVERMSLDGLVGPQARHADQAVVDLAKVGQELLAHMHGLVAPLAVPLFVDDQHALAVEAVRGSHLQQLHAPLCQRLRVPHGLGEEPLQTLGLWVRGADDRLRSGQGGQRLVALLAQEQALQIAPEAIALGALAEEGIDVLAIRFQGDWGQG